MRAGATNWLTIIGVLWHALVGCCAHHAHAADEHRPAAAVEVHVEHEQAPERCCRPHRDVEAAAFEAVDVDHSPEHRDGPADEPCDETTCSFLGAKRAATFELARLSSTWTWLSTTAAPQPAGAIARGNLVRPLDDRPPPLRSHLALQILLI